MLRAPEIQTIIERERHDTPNQRQETYFLFNEWIHGVTADSEYTESPMRRRQRYADPRAQPHLLGPLLELRKSLLGVPIGSMLWVLARHSVPDWRLFNRQVRERQRALTPNEILDFVGVLLQHDKEQMLKMQELANFIGESTGQFLRFTASRDRFADVHHSLIAIAARFTLHNRYCVVHALSDPPRRCGLRAGAIQRWMTRFR